MIEVGDIAWVQPIGDRASVGRVVHLDPVSIVLEDVVLIHDHGSWEPFHRGVLLADGQRAHVSASPKGERETYPRMICKHKVWAGDLDELRAWSDE